MTINKSMGYALAIIGVLVLSAGRVGAIGKHGGGHGHAGAKQSHGAKQHGAHNQKAASVHKNHAAGHKPTAHHGAGHKPQVQHNAKVTGIHQNHPGAHNTGTGLKHGHAGSWVPKPKATARQAVAAHAAHPKPGTALGLNRAANRMRPTDPNRLNHVSHNVRTQFAHNYRNFFTRTWWNNRFMANVANLRWYPHWWEHHNPHYWWRPATWGGFSQWIPGVAWSSPVVYEYGKQIYYRDDGVYVNGKRKYSTEQYYRLVRDLALTQPRSLSEKSEWMPLGVFALQRPKAAAPHVIVQLAVSKEGAIAGTSHNVNTDKTLPIHGALDKQTQRVAWVTGAGNKGKMVVETWAGNLTKDQSEVLVHFGEGKALKWFMVRMEAPKEGGTATSKRSRVHPWLAGL